MGKVETGLEIRAPVAVMHEMWTSKLHLISDICPEIVTAVALLEGQWGVEGSVIAWDRTLGGRPAAAREVIEVIDKENNRIVFTAVEGSPLESYKTFKWIFQASPDNNSVLWTLEYEKLDDDVPDPTPLLDSIVAVTKAIDARLIN